MFVDRCSGAGMLVGTYCVVIVSFLMYVLSWIIGKFTDIDLVSIVEDLFHPYILLLIYSYFCHFVFYSQFLAVNITKSVKIVGRN